ncbi:penicillin-binding protein 2 [Thermoleophilia bacterium SCSIO 60948]|nr:penicillin-binding protein 2 [Thermoleophilia bacterium SCSIO 60948]
MTGGRGFDNESRPTGARFPVRVAAIGGAAMLLFAVIFFRLWYLEVLSGDEYLAEAQDNQVREFTVQAPRGEILDRNGEPLVTNRTALALQIRTDELPSSRRKQSELFERTGELIGWSEKKIRKRIRQSTFEAPASPVTLERDVPYELVYYLAENQEEYRGVTVDRIYVRRYPEGSLAAHELGYVREISEDQIDDPQWKGIEPGDSIGQDGLEYTYDDVLRGINGATRVQVDANGLPTGRALSRREPEPGNDLVTSLDAGLQKTAEDAMEARGLPGAFAAIDPNTGEVLAMGSYPTYDPSVFAKPVVKQSDYKALTSESNDNPLYNRAIKGGYPTGSTFKPITAVAALDNGNLTTSRVIDDSTGCYSVGTQDFCNAGDAILGAQNLQGAMQVSSDVFFYTLGAEMNVDTGDGGALQDWARRFSFGSATGLDLPNEEPGRVPDPKWQNALVEDGFNPWTIGSNINFSVGQGDFLADPLQMAVAYSAIANGGKVMEPRLGMRVQDPDGRTLQQIQPEVRRTVELDPGWVDSIMAGLEDAAMAPGGTSYGCFGDFPVDIAGKTGTAERFGYEDQSWYVALAPADNPQIAIAMTMEEGGFGADSAAPAVKSVLTDFFDVKRVSPGCAVSATAE